MSQLTSWSIEFYAELVQVGAKQSHFMLAFNELDDIGVHSAARKNRLIRISSALCLLERSFTFAFLLMATT